MIKKTKIDFKKGVACLLAACQIAIVSGCGNYEQPNEDYSSTNINSTISDNIYNTANYRLIYLDGKIYLATFKEVEENKPNINGLICNQINYEYYDVTSGEFIGKVLESAPNEIHINGFSGAAFLDSEYYNGEYGYGKIIPSYSVTPLSDIIKSSNFTQDEYDYLTSDSEDLHKLIKNSKVFNKQVIVNFFVDFFFNYKEYGATVKLHKYTCFDKNGDENIFIGYKCSYNENDLGYNYIYDIITGSIKYVGKFKMDGFASVTEEEFDNSEKKSILELEQELSLDESQERTISRK